MFEHVLIGFARAQFLALEPKDRDEVEQLIGLIELDPWIDGVHKFSIVVAPLVLTAYDNRIWQIVYRIRDNAFIEVTGIRRLPR
jgi:hypothetical protein